MKIARELERRLERLVDGLSATVFRGKMHPVDLANRLLRAVDLNLTEGPLGPEIGNDLTVRVHPSELDEQIDVQALEAELAAAVAGLAADNGWRIGGPVMVRLAPDDHVGVGSITLDGRSTPGPLPPWCQLIDAAGGRVLEVGDNRTLIGRAADTDLTLTEPEISRHHAMILRSGTMPWLYDLGSANGTSVNGVALGDHPAALHPGDAITFGPVTFTFRLV